MLGLKSFGLKMPQLLREGLLLISCLAIAAICILSFGPVHFGGFDYSALADISYRIFLGQRPYVDFFTSTPVWFNLGGGLAYSLFGLHATSLVKLHALVTVVFGLWAFVLLRFVYPFALSLSLSLCPVFASGVFVSYWWYNPLSIYSGLLVIFSGLAIFSFYSDRDQGNQVLETGLIPKPILNPIPQPRSAPPPWLLWLSLGSALFLSYGTKPNYSFIIDASSLLLLFWFLKSARLFLVSTLALSLASFFFTLWLVDVSFISMVTSFLDVAGRASPSFAMFEQDASENVSRFWKLLLFSLIALLIFEFRRLKPNHRRGLEKSSVSTSTASVSIPIWAEGLLWLSMLIALKDNRPFAFFVHLLVLSFAHLRPERLRSWKMALCLLLLWISHHQNLNDWLLPWGFWGYLIWLGGIAWVFRDSPFRLLGLLSFFVGLLAMYTNGEPKLTDFPWVVAGAGLFLFDRLTVRNMHNRGLFVQSLQLLTVLICGIGIYLGQTRYRAIVIGFPNAESKITKVELDGSRFPYFQDAQGTETLQKLLEEVELVIQDLPDSHRQKVWFGNRLQFLYPVFEIAPRTDQASWYHPGVSISHEKFLRWFENFQNEDYDLLIFPKGDRSLLPTFADPSRFEKFELIERTTIDVYRRRK